MWHLWSCAVHGYLYVHLTYPLVSFWGLVKSILLFMVVTVIGHCKCSRNVCWNESVQLCTTNARFQSLIHTRSTLAWPHLCTFIFRHTHAHSHMHTYIHKLTLHTYTCTTFIHSNTFTHTCTLTMYTYTHVHTLAPQAKPQTCSYTHSHMQTHTCTHMREHISTLTLYHTCERWVLSRAFGCGMVRDQRVRSIEKLRHQS